MMIDILARLEEAIEGNRQLDKRIDALVTPDRYLIPIDGSIPIVLGHYICPDYTTSIDAALLLLPEGCAWSLSRSITFNCEAIVYGHDLHESMDAATPALAFSGAGLKARAALRAYLAFR